MLKALGHIVQEVSSCDDFAAAMDILVHRVRETIGTQACTVFLIDPNKQHYVMMATDGLNPQAIGNTIVDLDAGIIALIGQREEPINLSNAPDHPKYQLFSEVAEDRFKALLGAPLIHHRQLLGVLIVQQEEERAFDDTEEAFLITMSAQLAGIIAHAQATGNAELSGIACAAGVGIGQTIIVYPQADIDAVPDSKADDIEEEISCFQQALQQTREDIQQLNQRMSHVLPPAEQALFEVYLRMLDDNSLSKEIIANIYTGNCAQTALRNVMQEHLRQFQNMQDSYLRERADDLRDLGQRLLAHLQSQQSTDIDYPTQTILVGEDVTAAALAEVPEGHLAGIVSAKGSKNSHVAILARALGVPTIMGVKGLDLASLSKKEMIVDGYGEQIYIQPSANLRQSYISLAREEQELTANLEQLRDLPAQTPDGHCFSLFINTGLSNDVSLSLSVGAEGIGLFRTEVPFMLRDTFPSEEEQRILYRQLLQTFAPRPVIMRTLDVGGDKPLPYFPVVEDNPFLGWRGVRLTLDQPEIFMIQLRAMLKANLGLNNLRIMFPMISHVGEVDDALRLLAKAHKEVVEDNIDVPMPPVGVMIEVPSAVYQARAIARRADFLSVGSNDLIQYLLAVDRNNARVANLYDGLHPPVLEALIQIVESAHSVGKYASICGEMAGDPASVLLLMAMGFDALSMNTTSLPCIKWVINNFTRKQAQVLLKQALSMENPVMIRFHLEQALEAAGLGGLIRAGK